jgi:Flp pilus assembly protein TadD
MNFLQGVFMKMRYVMKMFVTVFASALLLVSPLAFAEATLPEVSQAIQSGQLAKADAMMKEVLQNHPNSAKANYIAAELYLREGKIDAARQAYIKAENLAPGIAICTSSIRATFASRVACWHGAC